MVRPGSGRFGVGFWVGFWVGLRARDFPTESHQQELLYYAFVGAALCRQIAPAPLLHTRGRRT